MGYRRLLRERRSTFGLVALAALSAAFALPAPGTGWNQNAHYALVRAMAEGHLDVDRARTEVGWQGTGDLSLYKGHYYASKPPGLAFAALPPYLVLKALGDTEPATDPAELLWLLGLWTTVLPTAVLLLLVRRVAEDVAPGYGTAAAVTLGVGTMVLPFASLFFAHALSTALIFGAFALLWGQRRGPTRLRTIWLAGVLAGLAFVVEYPVALIGAALAVLPLMRAPRLERGIAYACGALTGAIPALVYNFYAFGSATHFTYANLATGSNKAGLFGVHGPRFTVAVELLFSSIGLLTLMPVLLMSLVGLVLVYREGQRTEALVLSLVAGLYFLFNASYETPFGGWSPGPRYLMPMLPFLAVPLAAAYRRYPLVTLALACASAAGMVALTATQPLWAPFGDWFGRFRDGTFSGNALSFAGQHGLGIGLFLGLISIALVAAALATTGVRFSAIDAATAGACLLAWLVFQAKGPGLFGSDALGRGNGEVVVLLFALALGLAAIVLPRVLVLRSALGTARTPTG